MGYFSPYNLSSIPSPHRFKSVPLQSGFWGNKSISELVSAKKRLAEESKDNKYELEGLSSDLKGIRQAKVVSNVVEEPRNRALTEMRNAYPEYFDEDSGNTTKEGMDQLENYLKQEVTVYENKRSELKKNYDEVKKVLEEKKAVEENKNMVIPFITVYCPIIFSIFLTIFSFCIYFKLIDIYPLNFYMPEIVIPTIITSTVLFV